MKNQKNTKLGENKEIRKKVNEKWITVIIENEKTIGSTLYHLQKQNPKNCYYVRSIPRKEKDEK